MIVWNREGKKPKKYGTYLVLVQLKDSQRTEFDIAEWRPVRWRWQTNHWDGHVIWWTDLPEKGCFTDDYINVMKNQEVYHDVNG